MAYEQPRTQADWDRIMKSAEAKQLRINRAVSLQCAVQLLSALRPNEAIEEVLTDAIDMAKAFEKYLGEK